VASAKPWSLAATYIPKVMRALTEGDKIFSEVASAAGFTESQSILEAKRVLENLIEETKGLVILDFLDAGNWDCLQGVEADVENGMLKLIWRDYRDRQESEEKKEMRKFAFPAERYALILKFRELRIVNAGRFPVFMLRGYALKDKEIKTYLNNEAEEFALLDNQDNFSKLAVKKIDGEFESYTCLNTPIFSVIIIPKNSNASAFTSKKALFSYNLVDALRRLNNVKDELDVETLKDEDIICEKANTVRRIFEYVLKVELCYRYRQIIVKKDYSDLLLGDLIGLLKPFREGGIHDLLRKIAVWSNELSHDSGKPIQREKASLLTYLTIAYTELLKSEISLFLNPEPLSS